MSTPEMVRTRFAPSPTGYLHVGGARTALFNYLYAKAKGGKFILRIEDTDVERSTEESYHQMLESLDWLELVWDEGPGVGGPHGSYRQSERLETYKTHAAQLIKEKKAYYCFCTTEELDIKKKKREAMGLPPVYDGKCRNLSDKEIEEKLKQKLPHTMRFKTLDKEIIVKDMVQGDVKFDTALIGDFIMIKSNDYPSYNFAVVIDDHLMEINHVIRGVGHLSNTPRQILIYHAFDWKEPAWAHVSEIVGSDHKKLSKRHGATSITAFRDMGYPREAFVNYMSLLGWSPPEGKEFMSQDEIIGQFDVARCSKSPAMFDVFDLGKSGEVDLNLLSAKELEAYLFPKSKMNWLS
ncbi:MAG: glutamate--tRNA ligase, partial [Spirochaetia bacterium]|nr:glutamate--tRNA ligase [Spirochaetia bacterium]